MSKQFASKQFEAKQFAGDQLSGAVSQPPPGPGTSPCDGQFYANESDVIQIYGTSNVTTWADLDNLGDNNLMKTRVCWALQLAYEQINNRLYGGPYTVPFVMPAPYQVKDLNARLAGVLLYESRGIVDVPEGDKSSTHRLIYQRKLCEKIISGIHAGLIHLATLTGTTEIPVNQIDPPPTDSWPTRSPWVNQPVNSPWP
jgi:hypothetical protein